MHTKINLAKSTSAQHFTSSVKLCVSLRGLSCLFESRLNLIRDVDHFYDTRRDSLSTSLDTHDSSLIILIRGDVAGDLLSSQLADAKSFFCNVDRD